MINRIGVSDLDRSTLTKISSDPSVLRDIVDDGCDYSKVVVRKPWGYEYLLYQNNSVAVWILYLKEKAQTSMHCHPTKKTSLIVLEGQVTCSALDREVSRSVGQGLLIEKSVFHQTACNSPGGAFVMEVETPVNKRDLLRLKDKYGREGMGYEKSDNYSVHTQNYNYLHLIDSDFDSKQKKRFGNCTLTLKRIGTTAELHKLMRLHDDDVICVMKGEIHVQGTAARTLGPAETLVVHDLRNLVSNLTEVRIEKPIEVLLIRKMDHITKISDYIASRFRRNHFFFVPGDANVHLLDSLGRLEGARFSPCFTEKSASHAAEAYSKTTHEPAVLIVSSGGSSAGAISGVANAWVDSTPMVVISGQARSDQDFNVKTRQLGNKSLNIIDVVKPITKYAAKITDPMAIRFHLEKALYLAKAGRPGPVWLDVPIDIQGMAIDESELVGFDPATLETPIVLTEPDDLSEDLDKLIGLLKSAKRPVLLAGYGVQISKAKPEFLKLVDQLKIQSC